MGTATSKQEKEITDFKQTLSDRMTRYFTDIETNVLKFNIGNELEKDIFDSVHKIIKRIVREMEMCDERFELAARGIIEVEHHYSAAKVLSLNPFEFFLVIDELSRPGAVNIVPMNKGVADGLCEVYLTDPSLLPRWSKKSQYEGYGDNKLRTGNGLLSEFSRLVHRAISQLQRTSKDRVHCSSGKLFIHKQAVQYGAHPTLNIRLEWNEELVIMVSITPVLRCSDVSSYYDRSEATSATFYEAVTRIGSFLLVPQANRDVFKKSFVESEGYIIRTVISSNYLSALRLLAYLIDGRNMFKSEHLKMIDEFTVKNIVLSEAERNWTKGYTDIYVDDFVIQALNKIAVALSGSLFIGNVFLKDDNVVRYHEYETSAIERNKMGIARLVEHLVEDVTEPEEYLFNDIFCKMCPLNETVQSSPPRDMADSFKLQGAVGRTLDSKEKWDMANTSSHGQQGRGET